VGVTLEMAGEMSGALNRQAAVLLGDYQNVAGVNLTGSAEVVWRSSDPSVVTVEGNGWLTAIKPGVAVVTATFQGRTASREVTVRATPHALAHRYNFNEASGTAVLDVVGGAHGTILGTNYLRTGGQLQINLTNGSPVLTTYIDLPNGIISSQSNVTLEGWVTWVDAGPNWQRLFDFGLSTGGEGNSGTGTNTFFLCPRNASTGRLRTEIHTNTGMNLVIMDQPGNPAALPTNAAAHFAVVYSGTGRTMALYLNGVRVNLTNTTIPLSGLNDLNNWLGRSQYNDPYYRGWFQEFRIYREALLDAEVAASYAAGPDAVASGPAMANAAVKGQAPGVAWPAGTLGGSEGAWVWLYWGSADGGSDPQGWEQAVALGPQRPGPVWTKLAGLTPGATYYYRFYATNALGSSWAGSAASFTVPGLFNYAGFGYVTTNVLDGYTEPETLLNFPALVVLGPPLAGFSYDQFLSVNGADLRVVGPEGGELAYEVERWDPAGRSYVWVRVPELTNGTAVRLYWGKPGQAAPDYTTNGAVWGDGFAGVWHMTEKYVKDAARRGYDASYVNAPGAVSDTAGVIGVGQDYNAAAGNAYTTVGAINFTNLTLSAWVWCRDGSRTGVFMCKDGTPALGYGDLYFWQQNANLRFETFNWGQDVTVPLANTGGGGTETWLHLAATSDGVRQSFYTNGVLAGSWWKATAPGQNANAFQLAGSLKQAGRLHNGKLDECRAEWVSRSPAWIRASYLNQSAPGQFGRLSAVTALPLPLTLGPAVVTNVGTTAAWVRGRVVADGGNGVESWGTAWGTSPSPTGNAQGVAGATNAPLEFALESGGLAPGGHYYARAWASNGIEGVVYSTDAEFYTEPEAATGVGFSNVSNSAMTINWTPGNGSSGSLVVIRQGGPVATAPVDGVIYNAQTQYEQGSDLGGGTYVVYAGPSAELTVRNLRRGTVYHVAVFAYAGAGALINYQQDTPAAGSQPTASTAALEIADQLLIELHQSRGLSTDLNGAVLEWVNYGSVGGSFKTDGTADTYPTVAEVAGLPCVSFDGGDRLRASFAAPKSITGVNAQSQPEDYTIEYWVLNPVIAEQEWIFNWSRRGTSPRFAGVGYGSNAVWGVAAHWATPDMAFGEGVSIPGLASTPAAGVWHHLVVTYDGVTERAYVDGVLNAQEAKSLNIWDGDPVTLGWALSSALVYESVPFSGYVAGLRVHSKALTAGQVADNFGLGSLAAGPVYITGQPLSATVPEFSPVSFQASAVGALPVAYQWYRNDAPISGETNPLLSLPNVTAADNGATFYCVASNYLENSAHTATSAVAVLTVRSALQTLDHLWSFTADAADSKGNAHGDLINGAAVSAGSLVLNGVNQYVNLPNDLVTSYTSITVEAWITDEGSGAWARVWDFGNSTAGEDFPIGQEGPLGTRYMFLTARSSGGDLRGAYTITGGGAGEQIVSWPGTALPVGIKKHVAWTTDGPTQRGILYVDGLPVATNNAVTLTPAALGSTSNNWFGRAQFNDPFFKGRLDEVRIYDMALSPTQIQQSYLAGPDAYGPARIVAEPSNQLCSIPNSVTFNFAAGGGSPIAYQWYKNGNPVENATNANFTFFPTFADDGAQIYCVITNLWLGGGHTATTAVATLTVNRPPVAGLDTLGTVANRSVTLSTSKWLANDFDPDGDAWSLSSVSATSLMGGTITVNAGEATYTPPTDYQGLDEFTYLLTDARGGQSTGVVQVTVTAAGGQSGNQVSVEYQGPHTVLKFQGIPGRTYAIERALTLPSNNWENLGAAQASDTGRLLFTDTNAPPGSAFYRTRYP